MLWQMALLYSFFWLNSIPLDVCTISSLSVHGHLGFHFLATVNSAAVNIAVLASFLITAFKKEPVDKVPKSSLGLQNRMEKT